MSEIPLILFAKTPVAGTVKTRLTPELNLEQAVEVAKVLLEETLALSVRYWPGKVILAIWPDVQDGYIQSLLEQYNIPHIIQVEGDLGQKMLAAMDSQSYPCAVMGCDSPHLPGRELIKAHEYLLQAKDVIGPTFDGGYYFLGLQKSSPSLFDQQHWGTDQVLEHSQLKAQQQEIEFINLDILADVDTYEDLKVASESIERLKYFVT